ncbi:MAG: LysR family transcriptional regulator [Bacilli bacterium]|nr:LysR family transcriptional regulator [Bacilli bacterium]
MSLKRIRTFMMLVDYKNFSAVADVLSISQPAVSKQIKSLEEDLGVSLFDRNTVEPTEAGRLVYREGKKLLNGWEQLIEECRTLQGELTGLLRIGTSTVPSSYLLPAIVKQFRLRYPRIEYRIFVHDSEDILELLQNGKIDVAIIGSKPQAELFHSHPVAKDRMVIIGPLESEEIHGFGDLRGLPFIFRGERSGTWKAAELGLLKWNGKIEELNCVAQADSTDTVISLVEAGIGYSIVSDLAAKTAIENDRVTIVAELPVERNFYLTYLAVKQQHPAISALTQLVAGYAEEEHVESQP